MNGAVAADFFAFMRFVYIGNAIKEPCTVSGFSEGFLCFNYWKVHMPKDMG